MKLDLTNGQVSDEILEKIRKNSAGTKSLKTRNLKCPYCNHLSIVVFEDSRGHVQAKCRKCGKESIYNVMLRRNGEVMFRLVN